MSSAIVVTGLVRRFGAVRALDGIDFEVPTGTVFGLLGRNGAGKTTTVRVLATVLTPDSGRAEVLGHDVVREAPAVRAVIGLAGQYAAVDPNLTGTENLRLIGHLVHLPRREIAVRARDPLELFLLADAADRPVRTYSGGMRRRLDLAAALVHRPPVLFLDEPSTGLDLQGRSMLWDMIRQLVAEGTTVLLTTQYLEEADQLAHRIAVVEGGRVIADDTPAALKAQLGNTVIEVGLADDAVAVRAEQRLARLAGRDVERDGATVRVRSHDGAHPVMEILRALDSEGLEPATLTVREPSLDDVFLALTGQPTPDGPEPLVTTVRS
ncbi:MAG: ATP-binding cassette domain-containing protein [Mycobacteriales bacterium]